MVFLAVCFESFIFEGRVEFCVWFYDPDFIFEDTCLCFSEYVGMFECNRGDKAGEGMSEDIRPIVGATESYLYYSIINFFITEIEYHGYDLNLKK